MKYSVCQITPISDIVTGDIYVNGERVAENVKISIPIFYEYSRPPVQEVGICEWEESGVRIKEKA